jgi:hypothetical protein
VSRHPRGHDARPRRRRLPRDGQIIGAALTGGFGDAEKAELAERTRALAEANPLYPHLMPAAV